MKTVLCFKGSQANKFGNYFLRKCCRITGEGSEQVGKGKREGIDGEDRFQCQDVVNLAPGKRVGCAAMENPFLGSLKVSQPEPQCHCTAGC